MFNPLHPFERRFIPLFRAKGVQAFVKQTYRRGRLAFDDTHKEGFVLIHFERMLAAQQYFDVLKEDRHRAIFRMDDDDDMKKLEALLDEAAVFTMLKVKDAEWKARRVLDKKIRAYIDHRLGWHPSRSDDVVFSLDVQFGEVYARLKCRSKEIMVKLEEIETAGYVL
jgi:hypothetical protein